MAGQGDSKLRSVEGAGARESLGIEVTRFTVPNGEFKPIACLIFSTEAVECTGSKLSSLALPTGSSLTWDCSHGWLDFLLGLVA